MKPNIYFALTIGPIYKTMAMARKTRELWASSYLFSYLMEQMVTVVQSKGKLVLPVKSTASKIKAGLYPDRLILKITQKESTFAIVDGLVHGVFDSFVEGLPGTITNDKRSFFKHYFQIYTLEINLSEKEDPIRTILPILDSMEQKAAYVPEFEKDFLDEFLKNINDWEQYKVIFGARYRFPFVFEIATQGLKLAPTNNHKWKNSSQVYETIFNSVGRLKKEENEKFQLKLLKQYFNNTANNKDNPSKPGEQFRFYHKYMAIVQADGDNLSQALHALYTFGNVRAVQEFSRFLMDFGNEATKIIQDFSGTPIYMGGDDLLFFAPVMFNGRTVFHLIREIDELFQTMLVAAEDIARIICEWNGSATVENKRKKVDLSISYGVSISYHKYPLRESLESARMLLFEEAKMVEGKNALSFQILKHSGQYYGATFKKDWKSFYPYLFELLEKAGNEINFLTSVQNKLAPLRPALYRILVGREVDPAKASFRTDMIKYIPDETGREVFLKHLKDNFFNELVHKEKDTNYFLELTFKYLLQVYRDLEDIYGNNVFTAEKAVDSLYTLLRFIQFINQPDHNEEEN
jgi:CRISPR-associated protein Cmr2